MMAGVRLSGGVLAKSGDFYLLADFVGAGDGAEDGEGIICRGVIEGPVISLTQITEMVESRSIIATDGPWADVVSAVALGSHGEVRYLRGDGVQDDEIEQAGYGQDREKNVGLMTSIRQVDDSLFATGFGGQVYQKAIGENWRDVSIGDEDGQANLVFNDVSKGPADGTLVFVGTDLADNEFTDEMEAANDAGDAELLARLMLANVDDDEDYIAIRLYDGEWQTVDFGEEIGTIGVVIRQNETYLLFDGGGSIFATTDFDAFELVMPPRRFGAARDVKVWQDAPLLLYVDGLFVFTENGLQDFDPPLPGSTGECMSIATQASRIAAIFEDHVQLFEDGRWERLDLVALGGSVA